MDSKTLVKTPEELLGPLNEGEKKYAPVKLFLQGNLRLFEAGPRVSVVGTRSPSDQGCKDTINLIRYLVQNNIVIISGLAKGIDTIAHKTSMNENGRTIAVLGTPLDHCYPPENFKLQQAISKDHLVISQFPEGYPIQKSNFPLRNRTMALLSHATIIVEAGETSGTIHQGWEALRLGRPLFINNKLLESKELSWTKKMVDYGAVAVSLSDSGKILEALPTRGSRLLEVTFSA